MSKITDIDFCSNCIYLKEIKDDCGVHWGCKYALDCKSNASPYFPPSYYTPKKENDLIKGDSIDMAERVNHPSHYNRENAMETIDEMKLFFTPEEVMAFCKLNAWKYRARAPFKGHAIEDIEKSDWYIAEYKKIKDDHDKAQCTPLTYKDFSINC